MLPAVFAFLSWCRYFQGWLRRKLNIMLNTSVVEIYIFEKELYFRSQASRPGFFRQNSGRSFKLLDLRRTHQRSHSASSGGISSPPRLSPPSTPTGPEHPSWLPGEPYSRTCRRIPTVCIGMCSNVRPALDDEP